MNQYERIVSYLYRYEHGDKKENSGYVKVERREKECRVSLQVKLSMPLKEAKAYFYVQRPSGIRTIEIGTVQMGRNEMRLKKQTQTDDLCESGMGLDQMDGIFIYSGVTVCYATTWKNDYFYQGDWRQEDGGLVRRSPDLDEEERQKESQKKDKEKDEEKDQKKDPGMRESKVREEKVIEEHTGRRMEETIADKIEENIRGDIEENIEENIEEDLEEKIKGVFEETIGNNEEEKMIGITEAGIEGDIGKDFKENSEENMEGETEKALKENIEKNTEENSLKIQSVCEECPLKTGTAKDFGSRILRTLPTMYPFKDMERGCCVKMELQDIGCLPMRFWSLSGNRFLLHGYYCYRHLLFLKGEQGTYLLGVPGIYNEKEFKNSLKYGFTVFRPIGEDRRQGAFGYWLMKLV